MKSRISLIAAISAKNRGLGKNGDLLWKIPEDLKHFRDLTKSHPVIMGRKTWESLPREVRPMPGRANIVITRQKGYEALGAEVVPSVSDALIAAREALGSDEVFVIGGGEIYTEALLRAERLYLTLVEDQKEADVFFPPYKDTFTREISREDHQTQAGLKYSFITLER